MANETWAEEKAQEMFRQINNELTAGTTNYVGDWIRRAIRETIARCAEIDEGMLGDSVTEAVELQQAAIRKLGEP